MLDMLVKVDRRVMVWIMKSLRTCKLVHVNDMQVLAARGETFNPFFSEKVAGFLQAHMSSDQGPLVISCT